MKSLILLISILSTSAYAQKFSFTGSLLNFDNQTVSKCIVYSDINTFYEEKINILGINYLDNKLTNISLRRFIKNGVGGNLYIGRNEGLKLIFNTDSIFKILEISILDKEKNYRCTHFYEE